MDKLFRPEYPRPDFKRNNWIGLNGRWQFKIGLEERPGERDINVPFCPESTLSGVCDRGMNSWFTYTRQFDIPNAWMEAVRAGNQVWMIVGAVDYKCWVSINQKEVGVHEGGYDPFRVNITPALKAGENTVKVVVFDDPRSREQPRGKQSLESIPTGIDYHRVSGIWQSVWLELTGPSWLEWVFARPVRSATFTGFEVTCSVGKVEDIASHGDGGSRFSRHSLEGLRLRFELRDGGRAVAEKSAMVAGPESYVLLALPDPRYWRSEDPHLYELVVQLGPDAQPEAVHDEVAVTTGYRFFSTKAGKLLLNDEPVYMKMALAQGYWPDGLYTAPSVEAMRQDIKLALEFGLNGLRLHQIAAEPEFLHACDQMGLIVWGEFGHFRRYSELAMDRLRTQFLRVVERDRNHPCIQTWVPGNESWGFPFLGNRNRTKDNELLADIQGTASRSFLRSLVNAIRAKDGTRLVISNDGWEHVESDILTYHMYVDSEYFENVFPAMVEDGSLSEINPTRQIFTKDFVFSDQPIVLSECGGWALAEEGEKVTHYGTLCKDGDDLCQRYSGMIERLAKFPWNAGYCLTELYDQFQEMNGLATLERRPKFSPAKLAKANVTLGGKAWKQADARFPGKVWPDKGIP